jgi:CubicO group peptidase (beta-lactamase class C family)
MKPVPGAAFTVEDLLLHASGLPAWRPFYEAMIRRFGTDLHRVPVRERKTFFFQELDSVQVERGPREKIVYSDLGFLLLGRLLASDQAAGVGELFRSMPGVGLHYRPVIRSAIEERFLIRKRGESVMDTEICPWRGALTGLVHDDNAYSMGGVAGHAGLFGTLPDLKAWIQGLFSEKVVSLRTIERFSCTFSDASGQRRALGFDCPPTDWSGSTGRVFSPSTIGHLGFTGTSLWMDLSRGVYAVLLTNRVHPTREDPRIRPFRRAFHEEIGRFL